MNTRHLTTATALLLAALAGPAMALTIAPPPDIADGNCTGQCGATAASGDITLSPQGSGQYGYVATSGSSAYGVSPVTLDPNNRGGGIETNGSKFVSASFQAAAGDRLDVWFNYVSTDGKGYDDYAWARVVDASTGSLVAWVFTATSSNSGTRNIVPGDVVDKSQFDPDASIVNYDDYEFTSKDVSDPVDWAPLGGSNGTCWEDNAAGCGYTGWLLSRHDFAAAGSYRLEIGVVNWGDEAYDSGLAFDYGGLVSSVPEPASLPMALAGLGVFSLLAQRRQRNAALTNS
jgi:hypothetical protein